MILSRVHSLGALPLAGKVRRLASRLGRKIARREHRLLFAFACGPTGGRDAWGGLYRTEPGFRESVDASNTQLEKLLGFPAAALFRPEGPPRTHESSAAPGAAALRDELIRAGLSQFALFDLLTSAGVRPSGLVALGLGEIAAAYGSGALSREDATAVLCSAAATLSRDARPGSRFLLDTDAETARRLCRDAPARLVFHGTVSPGIQLLTGGAEEVSSTREYLQRRAAVRGELVAELGTHGPALPRRLTTLERDLRDIAPRPPALPVYSAAAAGLLTAETPPDAHFWDWVLRGRFDFAAAAAAAFDDGFDIVLNVGTDPLAGEWLRETASRRGHEVRFFDATRDGEPAGRACARAVMQVRALKLAGVPLRPARRPTDAATLDLSAPDVAANPFPHYEELRRGGPVHFLARQGFWLVIGYEEAGSALGQPQLFSNRAPEWLAVDRVLLGADPPAHTAVRRVVGQHFSAARLEAQTAFAERAAERLLRPLVAGEPCDVMREFAAPLVDEVVAHFLGFDEATLASFRAAHEGGTDLGAVLSALDSAIAAAADRLPIYGQLLRDGGGSLDAAEVRSIVRFLWIAGTTTTRRAVASSVLMLLRHAPVRARIESDPAQLSPFIEESLRLHPPEHLVARVTTQAVELSGVKIPAGAQVRLCLAAANRDPAHFDDPASFRLERAPNRHLSFGGGIHRCVGASLARLEAAAALRVLLRLAPRFRSVQPLGSLRYAGFADDTELLVIEC